MLTRFDNADGWGLPMHGQQPETVRARPALGDERVTAWLQLSATGGAIAGGGAAALVLARPRYGYHRLARRSAVVVGV